MQKHEQIRHCDWSVMGSDGIWIDIGMGGVEIRMEEFKANTPVKLCS